MITLGQYMLRTFVSAFLVVFFLAAPLITRFLVPGAGLSTYITGSFFIGMLGGLVGVMVSYVNYKRFIRPSEHILEALSSIGRKDLTVRVDEAETGYLKAVSGTLNRTTHLLEDHMKRMQEHAEIINATCSKQIHQMDSLHQANETVRTTAKKNEEEATRVLSNIQTLNMFMHDLNSQTEEVTSSTRQVMEHTEKIDETIRKQSIYTEETETSIVHLDDRFQDVETLMVSFNEQMKTITSIVHMIQNISERTNLLSLNASIEAARAGDQGKGFAVVANEIKHLANQSSESALDIETIISSLSEKSEGITEIMKRERVRVHETKTSFVHMKERSDDISHYIKQAVEQMTEILTGTSHVGEGVEQASLELNEATLFVENHTKQSGIIQETVHKTAEELEHFNAHINALSALSKELEDYTDSYTTKNKSTR
ncbi:hypothetical protein IMZ31_19705 (plasmid) [Pontibacillus sp. ALD_SL1]|uniref:methyl-accepting chemotaxis protein n=1 Tax=Pontibacillus sp. ALD_SL1 TaxID=2777185 RepID=UPI001A95E59D|nr:methyl-accepting chemotaxis protein [Pontibacillus sp. ALD_SL1]QST02778.1 hypothetical protein IMZ31_19705 [Pontibacillus sp. ALD_SL1]